MYVCMYVHMIHMYGMKCPYIVIYLFSSGKFFFFSFPPLRDTHSLSLFFFPPSVPLFLSLAQTLSHFSSPTYVHIRITYIIHMYICITWSEPKSKGDPNRNGPCETNYGTALFKLAIIISIFILSRFLRFYILDGKVDYLSETSFFFTNNGLIFFFFLESSTWGVLMRKCVCGFTVYRNTELTSESTLYKYIHVTVVHKLLYYCTIHTHSLFFCKKKKIDIKIT